MYEDEVQDISYSFDGCTLAISPTDIDLIGSNSCKNRANNRTSISEEAMGPGCGNTGQPTPQYEFN